MVSQFAEILPRAMGAQTEQGLDRQIKKQFRSCAPREAIGMVCVSPEYFIGDVTIRADGRVDFKTKEERCEFACS